MVVYSEESEEGSEGDVENNRVYHVSPEVHFSSAKMIRHVYWQFLHFSSDNHVYHNNVLLKKITHDKSELQLFDTCKLCQSRVHN